MAETGELTVIGQGTVLRGELQAAGPVRVLGSVEGQVSCTSELHIGPSAQVSASVEAETVVVEGRVQGDILARQRLQLGPKANVQGDITSGALTVAEGATFVGRVAVGGEAVSGFRKQTPDAKPRAAKPQATEPKPETTTADWLGQQAKTPSWVKAAAGTDA